MLAYKFLADGAVAPFTGRRWPLPEARAPGAWVVARPCDLARYGVHACRVEDLAYRLDDELWLVELEDPIARTPFQVVAARGRLPRRITAWNGASSHEYAAACAWRARDLAVEGLVRAGSNAEAAALRACIDLPSLEARANTLAGDATPEEPRGLAAYVAGAALRARQGRFREASLQCAHLGAALARSEAGADQERAWQSQWLGHRLGLREAGARSGLETFPM
jgi:hypothetical protein